MHPYFWRFIRRNFLLCVKGQRVIGTKIPNACSVPHNKILVSIGKYNQPNLKCARTWRISWSVSPMKGKPIVPGGRGLPQLGSTRRINNISHNLTAARKSKTGSTMVQRKVTMRVYSPMLKRATIAKELLERRCVFTRRLRAFFSCAPLYIQRAQVSSCYLPQIN